MAYKNKLQPLTIPYHKARFGKGSPAKLLQIPLLRILTYYGCHQFIAGDNDLSVWDVLTDIV